MLNGIDPICFGNQPDAPRGWDITMPSINIAETVSEAGTVVFPQRVWIKRDPQWVHILIETKGLKEYIQAAKGPGIYLSLFFDSDGDAKTGGPEKKVAGQQLLGFDMRANFSTMQIQDKDGNISSLLNCQVQKWMGRYIQAI